MAARAYLRPDWPTPSWLHAAVSTRAGGVSQGPYATFNLGDHVDDDEAAVAENRRLLAADLGLPAPPQWLRQVHGTVIVEVGTTRLEPPEADGVVTGTAGVVLAVLSADCLPVLACDPEGRRVGAFHAGWRGLASGVLERGLEALGGDPGRLLVYLGPAIGPDHFEVGGEVHAVFTAADRDAERAFTPVAGGRFLADLFALARGRLQRAGVHPRSIFGGAHCTFAQPGRFFSYRRNGPCGRMASLIWMDP